MLPLRPWDRVPPLAPLAPGRGMAALRLARAVGPPLHARARAPPLLLALLCATLAARTPEAVIVAPASSGASAILDMLTARSARAGPAVRQCPSAQPANPFGEVARRALAGFVPKEELPPKYKTGWRAQCVHARTRKRKPAADRAVADAAQARLAALWDARARNEGRLPARLLRLRESDGGLPPTPRPAREPTPRARYARPRSGPVSLATPVACGPPEFHDDANAMRRHGPLARFDACAVVVLTASFGAQDALHAPLGVDADAVEGPVCYAAFADDASIRAWKLDDPRTPGVVPLDAHGDAAAPAIKPGAYQVRHWTVLRWANGDNRAPLLQDPRRLARHVKTLAHVLFPCALYTVWVDTKYQLRVHPLLLLSRFVWGEGDSPGGDPSAPLSVPSLKVVVGAHPQRAGIIAEIDALKSKPELRARMNITALDEQRATYVREGVERGGPGGMSDTALLLRLNAAPDVQRLGCMWSCELRHFDHTRDQPSWQYLLSAHFERRGHEASARMVDRCLWTSAYIEHGHMQRHGGG